jgi:hypothetical protein
LLNGSYGELEETSTYGSYAFSTISHFLIYAPLEKFYELKALSKEDLNTILESVLDIYSPADNSPEIVSIDFRLRAEANDEDEVEINELLPNSEVLNFFISYSHSDRIVAAQIKESLVDFGFTVFLAHEDIIPSTEWQERILLELKICDVFLPLLTENFKNSVWTGQEIGIAYAGQKLIIPLRIEIVPFGFISKFQALNFKDIKLVRGEIIDIIAQRQDKIKLIDSLIKGFSKSNNFANANERVYYIKKFQDELNVKQIVEIIKGAFGNSQIYDEQYDTGPFIRNFITKHKDKKKEVLESLKADLITGFGNEEGWTVDDEYVLKEIRVRLKINF